MTAAEMRLDSCGDAARAMLDSCGDVQARYEAPAARHFSFPVKRGRAACPDLVKGGLRWRGGALRVSRKAKFTAAPLRRHRERGRTLHLCAHGTTAAD